jgi:HK97 family phage major capsid protein
LIPLPNPVLSRKLEERATEVATMDHILEQVEGRDLVDAERDLLTTAEKRIAALDAQIEPLRAYEALARAHADALPVLAPPQAAPVETRRVGGDDRAMQYRSAGEFLVDYLRGHGIMERGVVDPQAAARVAQSRAVVNNVTTDLTGILPTPIVGSVVNLIDANRPLISSLGGAMALGGIPGSTFTRPKITQHVTVGQQTAEKTELASQKMLITPVPFTKATYGGTVDISRQAIDWTSPGAWDILVRDLANVYAIQTETVIAAAFKTAATGTAVPVATDDLKGWAAALYAAAAASYQAAKRMPDRIWCSLDVWAALGSLVDIARLVMPPSQTEQPAGDAELGSFRGDVIGLPRIVVPTFPSGTCIVGPSTLYEVYEEVIGLLSVVEPSILGVTVAYGGYIAYGSLGPTAFVPLTAPAGMLTIDPASLDDTSDEASAPASKSAKS